MAKPRSVDARGLLYHFLQKDLREQDIWLFQMLTTRLITSLGIWLHPDVYERLPVLVPYAVRDPLWRKLESGEPSAREPLTYSFVPNLVWLPGEIAALTDRQGFAQLYVQALATKLYRHRPVPTSLQPLAEEAWKKLPEPVGVPEQGLPDVSDLHYFTPTDAWLNGRINKVRLVADALEGALAGAAVQSKVISGRYGSGLAALPSQSSFARRGATALLKRLRAFG